MFSLNKQDVFELRQAEEFYGIAISEAALLLSMRQASICEKHGVAFGTPGRFAVDSTGEILWLETLKSEGELPSTAEAVEEKPLIEVVSG